MRAFLALILLTAPVRAAEVYIGVEGGRTGSQRALGLPPFLSEDPKRLDDAEAGRALREILRADLLTSRYFDVIEKGPAEASPSRPLLGALSIPHSPLVLPLPG